MSEGRNTQTFNKPDTEDTIDLMELAQVLLRRGWALVLALVIGASAAGIFTKLFVTPQYQATSMIYVYSKSTSITSLADLQIGSQLAVDFQIVATTREVMESVIESVGLSTTYDKLLDTIDITNPSGSHILEIKVKNPDPQLASKRAAWWPFPRKPFTAWGPTAWTRMQLLKFSRPRAAPRIIL